MVQPLNIRGITLQTVQRFLKKKKLQIDLTMESLLDIYAAKKNKSNLKRYTHPSVHSSTVYLE